MKISNEIREWCKWCSEHSAARDSLCKLADRIDREMVELPRDKDGVSIHVGDTVYTTDGRVANVSKIYIMQHTVRVLCIFSDGWGTAFPSNELTHTRPDSFERIADELEEWSEDNRINGDGEVFDRARQFSERIRKLAKKEDLRDRPRVRGQRSM